MSRPMIAHFDLEESLAHYGIKGMRWGVRNLDASAPNVRTKGVTVRADGSISVEKGTSLQRLVRSSGESRPLKDLTYASMLEYDNARYIKAIGGKGFLSGGRDQILNLSTTTKLIAPSLLEATKINSDLMTSDTKYFDSVKTSSLTGGITSKEFARIQADPVGKDAVAWYETANTALTYNESIMPGITYAQNRLRSEIEAKGYNALRDENDFSSGLSKAPIIIFAPEKSLKATTVTDITDSLRTANKQQLKQYKSRGKEWLERELYVT